MAAQDWSTEDIDLAKKYFISGLAIKDIARIIGRTPTSTNKALTRFGIRLKNQRLNLTNTSKNTISLKNKAPGFDKKSLNIQFDNWVSFWKVCDYLSAQKIYIFEQSNYGTQLEKRIFLVEHNVYSAAQLLMMANKIRVDNDQPAFLVEGLSW